MSLKETVRNMGKKIGIGRLLLLGLAGALLVLCSLDFGSVLFETSEEAEAADGSEKTASSGSSDTDSTDPLAGVSALTDVPYAEAEENLSMTELEARLEARLRELLSQIEGVGEVEVMVILSSGVGKEILKDTVTSKDEVTETDSAGGSRQSLSYDQSEDTIMDEAGDASSQTPYVLSNLAPGISGIAVVAQGGGDAQVAAEITELVLALFDIDITQVSVAQMK